MDRRPKDLDGITQAYRELRAPSGAHQQAVARFAVRQIKVRLGWWPAAAFASVVGFAALIAPNVWQASHDESIAASPIALNRLSLEQPLTVRTPTLAALSLPASSVLQVPHLNRISTLKQAMQQETL